VGDAEIHGDATLSLVRALVEAPSKRVFLHATGRELGALCREVLEDTANEGAFASVDVTEHDEGEL
jgi:hypothetical protein